MKLITELILIPISCAVSKSRDAARMAVPIFVWLISCVSTTTSATTSTGVTSVTTFVDVPAMVTCADSPGSSGYICGSPPVTYVARFCSR